MFLKRYLYKHGARLICKRIDALKDNGEDFRKSSEVFAIRRFLIQAPELAKDLFNPKVLSLIRSLSPYAAVVRSVYFDKPAASNWFVAPHQDLIVQVSDRIVSPNYTNWTFKHGRYAVQPPVKILENMFTLRLHLDAADERNGALQVLPGSHLKGIVRRDQLGNQAAYVNCYAAAGTLMLMKPLLMHRSSKSKHHGRRRIIHIELSGDELPDGLRWSERMAVFDSNLSLQ
ncbi:phytanoyl-CoA dioxygenase family protein [Pedobacter sp. SYP-B3415]|uniref:phytanoyl-CoA dioxygenase family protein n=1 Tax=Pedobacter sp. SYP-B3415 TaxID=2496641 RepID=UPI00101BC2CD|nr:phytanoyl-CoA dioxygenase family protein [Pedobacter sp. SYP-B3415]